MLRNRQIDAMRGLAALAVLNHHVLLSSSTFSNAYYENKTSNIVVWLFTFTPLRLSWAGPEAVTLFFVISGIALASLYEKLHSYRNFAKSRVVRLYLPSLILAVISIMLSLLLHPYFGPPSSSWLANVTPVENLSPRQLTLQGVQGMSPLWSTRLEILFSLCIPGAIWLTRKLKLVTLLILMMGVSYIGFENFGNLGVLNQVLAYAPFFMIGVTFKTRAVEFSNSLRSKPTFLMLIGISLISVRWTHVSDASWLFVIQGIGASVIVLGISRLEAPNLFLNSRVVQWFGSRSFSLYLAHGPIVYFLAYLFDSTPLTMILMFFSSIAITELVERLLIRPTHRFARKLLLD